MKQILNCLVFFTFLLSLRKCCAATNNNPDICETESCKALGASIRDSIDQSINPCDDFYEFSCGGWRKANPIPDDRDQLSGMSQVMVKMQSIMRSEMSQPSTESDSFSVRYALDFYKTCSDEEAMDRRGYLPVNIMNAMGGWPLLGYHSAFNEEEYDWENALVYLFAFVGQTAIFDTIVGPDANQTDTNILYLGVPEFGLGRNQLVNISDNQEIVNAYKKYILQSALLLGGEDSDQTNQDVDDLIDFESELAKVSTKPEDMRSSKVWYNRMTFDQLNNLTDNRLNWFKIIADIIKYYSDIELKGEDYVIVSDINYYKGVAHLMTNTPKRVIANYLGWVAVRKLGVFTTKEFRDIEFEFQRINSGVQKSKPLWKHCIDSLESYLPFAYSRKFIDNHFDINTKHEVENIMTYMRIATKIALRDNEWLDEMTRRKAIEKLNAISENVAYPEWMLNNDELDAFYNLV